MFLYLDGTRGTGLSLHLLAHRKGERHKRLDLSFGEITEPTDSTLLSSVFGLVAELLHQEGVRLDFCGIGVSHIFVNGARASAAGDLIDLARLATLASWALGFAYDVPVVEVAGPVAPADLIRLSSDAVSASGQKRLVTDGVVLDAARVFALSALGWAMLEAGLAAPAIPAFEKSVARVGADEPLRIDLMRGLGLAHLHARNFVQAIVPLRNVAGANPHSAEAWFELSRAYAGAGVTSRAREALQRAMRLDPRLVDSLLYALDDSSPGEAEAAAAVTALRYSVSRG